MNNRLLASAKCAVLALLVVLVASCSKTSELLNYVPADTKFAATVSLGDLIKKSNIKDLNLPDNDEQLKKLVNGDYGLAYDKAVSLEYKDRLFAFIFGREENKAWTLSLYNAVNGSHYTVPSAIQMTTSNHL